MCILVALLAAGWTARGHAQPAAAIREDDTVNFLKLRTEKFLNGVGQGNVEASLDELLINSPLAKDAKKIVRLKEGLGDGLAAYGTFLEAEAIQAERVGKALVRCVYLYHCETFPVVWHLTYYRSSESEGWKLIELRYDLDYERLK